MDVRRFVFTFIAIIVLSPSALAQSGGAASNQTNRAAGRGEYGVNLTFAVFQYDPQRSPALEEITRLNSSYSSADEELGYLKDKHKLDELAVRHARTVGLRTAETFNDAVLLGPEYMTLTITPSEVIRGSMKLDVRVRYANRPLLDVKNIELDSYETVLLRGGKGMFGVKYYIGAGGAQQSAPIERALLVSVTPQIVPLTNLRNRPEQLSHPVDEFGRPVEMKEGDRFTPPVAVERVAPKFESGQAVHGSVLLACVITPEGKVTNVRVIRSIDSLIDDRAMQAFRQYKFSPALLNGQPVYATFREEISFASPPQLEPEPAQKQEQKKKTTLPFPRRRFPFPLARP
ncbi:MAG TPA: energy transducer TonB [Blastocatellia bacterium]|nr:energy transducer TonB [Blastocatellia bacterium]